MAMFIHLETVRAWATVDAVSLVEADAGRRGTVHAGKGPVPSEIRKERQRKAQM
jgi:hypothetical protein